MFDSFCPRCPLTENCKCQQYDFIHCEPRRDYIGMQNNLNEMNCFANSALQLIFSITPFQSESVANQKYFINPNTFTDRVLRLQESIQAKLKQSKKETVDITKIRQDLRNYNRAQFEINEKADSMEAYQAILYLMHKEYNNQFEQNCECISHRHFGILTYESYTCLADESHSNNYQEESFAQHLLVERLLKNVDFEHKQSLVLEPDKSIRREKSVLLRLEPFLDVLRDSLRGKCYDKRCGKCSGQLDTRYLKLRTIPNVYTIQLVWAKENPSIDKILQVIKGIPHCIDLKDLYDCVDESTIHVLRGMIVKILDHYVYLVRNELNQWLIINDSFIKLIYTGEFYCVPFLLLSLNAYPVGLFYERSQLKPDPPVVDEDNWLYYEYRVYLLEIYYLRQIRFDELEWICFYCNHFNQKNSEKFCKNCDSARVMKLENWTCGQCKQVNNSDVVLCDSCKFKRFLPKNQSKIHKECECLALIAPGVCQDCNELDECIVCGCTLYNGMTVICSRCSCKIIRYPYCECNILDSEPCCKFCIEKMTPCENCQKLIFLTDPVCIYCSSAKENSEKCKKCGKLGNEATCKDCRKITEVICLICSQKVNTAACFICPICDKEIENSFCKVCDYEVCYSRFVCGLCRESAKRCFSCGSGLILPDDDCCHLCRTKKVGG